MMSNKRSLATSEESDTVDDLFVAAKYAAEVASTTGLLTELDDDEISLSSSVGSTDVAKSDAVGGAAFIDAKETAPNDGELSDADSELDLASELETIIRKEGEAEELGVPKRKQKILTANEVDPYHANISELQEKLRLKVTLSDVDIQNGRWEVAGVLQHHMLQERTVVVLSRAGGTLLEEGSVLSLRKSEFDVLSGIEAIPDYIFLGSILEVFGPVSRPLYSVRFDDVSQPKKTKHVISMQIPGDSEVSKPDDESTPKVQDPWSPNGVYTKALQGHVGDTLVYFLANGQSSATRFLDTATIYQNSTRGCDASNVYDEEVMHHSEMDFSDDEKERMAKRKGGKNNNRRERSGTQVPPGFLHHGVNVQQPSWPTARRPQLNIHPPPLPPPPHNPITQSQQEDSGSDTEYYAFD